MGIQPHYYIHNTHIDIYLLDLNIIRSCYSTLYLARQKFTIALVNRGLIERQNAFQYRQKRFSFPIN